MSPDSDNQLHLLEMSRKSELIVLAWGAPGAQGVKTYLPLLASDNLWCLGKTKSGAPRHPLYLRRDTPLEKWL
jgi:hypothetical protein